MEFLKLIELNNLREIRPNIDGFDFLILRTQNPMDASPWGFDSLLRHHEINELQDADAEY